jgi:hypothetical protein
VASHLQFDCRKYTLKEIRLPPFVDSELGMNMTTVKWIADQARNDILRTHEDGT